jgi:hypothetical protein
MNPIRQLSIISVGILSIVLITTGCSKDEVGEPPELSPMESFQMDFSYFNDPSDTLGGEKSLSQYHNWGSAFATVSAWKAFVTLGMAVPVASYTEALKQEAVYLGENRWEWTYDVTVKMISYSARLIAERISNDEFTASMYITRSGAGGFNEFKWFEGTIRYDHTHASWTIYENPEDPAALVNIDWNRDWEAETADITYTNVREGNSEYGSFISFSVDPDRDYDAAYTISISRGETFIEWNRSTKAGRIKSQERFGDDLWRCWNGQLQNIDCQ